MTSLPPNDSDILTMEESLLILGSHYNLGFLSLEQDLALRRLITRARSLVARVRYGEEE
jgi:hypothetical protein